MSHRTTTAVSVTAAALAAAAPASRPLPPPDPLPFTGVTLAGGEFGVKRPGQPRVYGKDYVFPSPAEVDHFAGLGMNVIRLPFLWESLQPALGKPLDAAEMARLAAVVRTITSRGCVALLDPHDFARHFGRPIGGPDVSAADFADFWRRLAPPFAADDRVWFGLVNEPHDLPADHWLAAANAAIAAVRGAGAPNLILVPGVAWSGAHSWAASGNAVTMLGVVDPADRTVFEVHQYLDHDSSGTTPEVVGPTAGRDRLAGFTDWCRSHHKRAFLGEFAAADGPVGRAAVDDMLRAMEDAPDVWTGWAWWAAGPWWKDYMFSIEPRPGRPDPPQVAWLRPHLNGADRR